MHTLSRKAILIVLLIIVVFLGIASRILWNYLKPPILPLSCIRSIENKFSYQGDIIASWAYGWEVRGQKYPWCTENDIFVYACEKWQVRSQKWAACDIGASISSIPWETKDQEKSLWKFFPWGINRGVVLGEYASWTSDGLWTSIMVYLSYTPPRISDWSTDPVWPCEKWYHIPSQAEWKISASYLNNKTLESLRLSTLWILDEKMQSLFNVWESQYWSSTIANLSNDIFAKTIEIDHSSAYITMIADWWKQVFLDSYKKKTERARIRCIQNTVTP